MRRPLLSIFLLLVAALGAQSEEAYWKTKLRPAMRNYIDDIRILRITSSNLDGIWEPEQTPQKWDILELFVTRKKITEEQFEVISAWVKAGKGLVADATIASQLIGLSTETFVSDRFYNTVLEGTPVSAGAHEIMIDIYGYSSSPRRIKFIRDRVMSFTPILVSASDPGIITAIIAPFGSGRIFSMSTISSNETCDPEWFGLSSYLNTKELTNYKDGVRFAFNTILWLAKKEGRLSAAAPAQELAATPGLADPRAMGAVLGRVFNLDGPDDRLNLRSRPDKTGEILAKLGPDEALTILGRTGGADFWYKVRTKPGLEGYCHKDYVSVDRALLDAVTVADALGNYVVSVAKAVEQGYKIYNYTSTDELIDLAGSPETQKAVAELFSSVDYLNSVFKF